MGTFAFFRNFLRNYNILKLYSQCFIVYKIWSIINSSNLNVFLEDKHCSHFLRKMEKSHVFMKKKKEIQRG